MRLLPTLFWLATLVIVAACAQQKPIPRATPVRRTTVTWHKATQEFPYRWSDEASEIPHAEFRTSPIELPEMPPAIVQLNGVTLQ